jgi:hypothetical protein
MLAQSARGVDLARSPLSSDSEERRASTSFTIHISINLVVKETAEWTRATLGFLSHTRAQSRAPSPPQPQPRAATVSHSAHRTHTHTLENAHQS